MSQKIQILDDNLINKIAAGEVIESPVSVIKELVENAIDAKAKNIVIEVKKSGLESVRVEDDGIGMRKEDAHLCFKRHATSKIKTFEDLTKVGSMGFRGEALASIAAISRVEIKTSIKDIATHLKLDRAKIVFEKQIARTKGTTIEIKSLFFNVPVRRKFQKNLSLINSEIIKVVMSLSLSRGEIGFKLILNGKTQISTKPAYDDKKMVFKKRIKDLLSKEFIKNSIDVDFSDNNIEIFGSISDPNFCRKTKTNQYLIVNNRSVYSSMLSKFVKEAYATKIKEDEFPMFALHIKVPFEFVDVNVHPQKKEIRIRENLFIKDTIKKAVDLAFENKFQKKGLYTTNNFFAYDYNFTDPKKEDRFFEVEKENIFEKFEKQLIFEKFYDIDSFDLDFLKVDFFLFIESRFLKGFLNLEDDEKIVIIDLSAIFSIFLFEKIKNKKNTFVSQKLLVPINIHVNAEDIAFVEDNISKFFNFGFEIRIISKDQIVIDAAFQMLEKENIFDLFFLVLEDFKLYDKELVVDKIYEKKLVQDISRIAKTKSYSDEEAINLVKFFIKNKTFYDPQGSKVVKKLNKNDIERIIKK